MTMQKIYVEPVEGRVAYNCDTNRWIKGVTEVNKTKSVIRMLKKGELKLTKKPSESKKSKS